MSKKLLALSMVAFVGVKSVLASPMNRQDYNDYRGWELPADEDGSDDGYLVEYIDGGKSNHSEHKGYISWSPKEVFEKAYKLNSSLSFSDALSALKNGEKIARSGWNGKDQYVVAQSESTTTDASKIWNSHNKKYAESLGGKISVAPYCTLKTAQDTLAMGWTPSTGDLFANDWQIIKD